MASCKEILAGKKIERELRMRACFVCGSRGVWFDLKGAGGVLQLKYFDRGRERLSFFLVFF